MTQNELWNLGLESIRSLEVDLGILASGRDEAYGCIFGRDSLIVSLLLLRIKKIKNEGEKNGKKDGEQENFLSLIKKILFHLGELQGKEFNIESGEEPGKIIHEYRKDKHEHLTQALLNPWYVYLDGTMRNYDSVDSTPLFLMALHKYGEVSGDWNFVKEMEEKAKLSLSWILRNCDGDNQDNFVKYSFSQDRKFGGLKTQSWMDSSESIFFENSEETPAYPIAPLEVQAYAWAALKMWSKYFKPLDLEFSLELSEKSENLKKEFNKKYVVNRAGFVSLAYAIDGNGKRLASPRSSMGHVLWAAYDNEAILDKEFIIPIVSRILRKDLFVPRAGVRTLSTKSKKYNASSYHNGSIWPHDTAILAQGLENFGFFSDAKKVKEALLGTYVYFKTPIELVTYKYKLREYESREGQKACRIQAWSAAGLLAILSMEESANIDLL